MKTNLRLIGGQKIESPNNIHTRPTTMMVREAIFNILGNKVENSNWLDLFSGTGAISCEAYNHGAKKIVAVEKNKENSKICFRNLLSLQNSGSRKNDFQVICKDVLSWVKSNKERKNLSNFNNFDKIKFDFIYMDPPYRAGYYELVLKQIFNCDFMRKESIVICEHSLDLEFKNNDLWEIHDVRTYGQSRLTFLIQIQHTRTSSVLIPGTNK